MKTDAMSLPNGTLLQGGKYKIVRFINAGGFGCTYEALHTQLDSRVAIKEFFVKDFCNREEGTGHITVGTKSKTETVAKLKKKFIEEARALFKMHHEGIVRVIDTFEENDTSYYVMEYIEGTSLHELVHYGPLPEAKAVAYIRQVAKALEYVHSLNRLHLDIKPGNIMLTSKGIPVLIDFGASKHYDEDSGENNSTLLGVNTKGYAPVEQINQSFISFSPATDIYALGATLYKLLTGITPPSSVDLMSQEETLAPLPNSISASTRQAVAAAMQLLRKNRPQTVAEWLVILTPKTDKDETFLDIEYNQKNIKTTYRLAYGLLLFFIEVIFAIVMLSTSRESDLDSDGMLLAFVFPLLCVSAVIYLYKIKNTINKRKWNVIKISSTGLCFINSFLLPMWNGSLTLSYFCLSIGLSLISFYTFLMKK